MLKMELKELIDKASEYLPANDIVKIKKAYQFALDSGKSDLDRALESALILADFQMGSSCLAAVLLQGLPSEANIPLKAIAAKFGPNVKNLVDGIEKINSIPWLSPTKAQSESLRRMFLAMAEDVRVLIIALANRLQMMRNINKLPSEERESLSQETMEIYAPLARRLGIHGIQSELEDTAFLQLHPQEFGRITNVLNIQKAEWKKYINHVTRVLREEFQKADLQAEISGRPKSVYSIYTKMGAYAKQGKELNDINDLLALRVLVDQVADCYYALGIIHRLWHPLAGQFDDYIANPKPNLYRSLHTTVLAPRGRSLEIQIRTHEMHHINEYGVAAHWRYKEGTQTDVHFESKMSWLRRVMGWQKGSSGETFLESIKTDVFKDQVFVFTPVGEVKELPQGSTPLDFAYRIHTSLGHRCTGAKVNGKLVPLTYQLQNGDVVEVMKTKSERGPSLDWLNPDSGYVRSNHAREKIRQWFRRRERAENLERGKGLFDKERKRLSISASAEEIAPLFGYADVNEFLIAIGCGDVNVSQIGSKIAPKEEDAEIIAPASTAMPSQPITAAGVQVLGVGDLLTHIAPCCMPVPGDEIVGYVTRSRGVTIHRADCPNISGNKVEKERIVHVSWGVQQEVYPVSITIEAEDRMGLLKDISTVISEAKINISSISTVENRDSFVKFVLTVDVPDIGYLSQLLSRLERLNGVISASRVSKYAKAG